MLLPKRPQSAPDASQVDRRYVTASPRQSASPGARGGTGTRPRYGRASRHNYETYLPYGRMAVTVVAPCLLGCRVPTRQRAVRRGTRTDPIATYLCRHYHEVAASSDEESNVIADS
jgi:hypothetical protein